MIEVKLNRGKVALVDEEDFDTISSVNWNAHPEKHRWYATGKINDRAVKMHRMILGVTDSSVIVDHIDGDGLNNRKSNLRIATNSENLCNQRPRENFTSKYKGVHWDRFNNKWRVQVQKGKTVVRVGRFDDETEAALAYNEAAKELQGEFARLNII